MIPTLQQLLGSDAANAKVWTVRCGADNRVTQRFEYNGQPALLQPNEVVCSREQHDTYLDWVLVGGQLVHQPLTPQLTAFTSAVLGVEYTYEYASEDQLRIMRKVTLGVGGTVRCADASGWSLLWHTDAQLRQLLADLDVFLN